MPADRTPMPASVRAQDPSLTHVDNAYCPPCSFGAGHPVYCVRPPLCERCREGYVTDEDSGLCADCVAYNAGRVTL